MSNRREVYRIVTSYVYSDIDKRKVNRLVLVSFLCVITISLSFLVNIFYYTYMNANNSIASKVLNIDTEIELDVVNRIDHVDMAVSQEEAFSYLDTDILIEDRVYSSEYALIGSNDLVLFNLFDNEYNLEDNEILLPKKIKFKDKVLDSSKLLGDNIVLLIPYKHYFHGDNHNILSEIRDYIKFEVKVVGVYEKDIFNDFIDNTFFTNNDTLLKINTILKGDFETEIDKLFYNNVIFIDNVENISLVENELKDLKINSSRMLNMNQGLIFFVEFLCLAISVAFIIAAMVIIIINYNDVIMTSFDNVIVLRNFGFSIKSIINKCIVFNILEITKAFMASTIPSLMLSILLFYGLLGWELKVGLWGICNIVICFLINILASLYLFKEYIGILYDYT